MKLTGNGIGQEILRYALRQCIGQGGHTLYIGKVLYLIGHFPLCHCRSIGIHGQHHVASPKFPDNYLVVRIDLGSLAGPHSTVAVQKIIHSLGHISRRRQNQHNDKGCVAHPVNPFAEFPESWKEGAVPCLIIPLGKLKNHGRHKEQHGYQAEHDSLCQHQTHIEPNGKLHGYQCHHGGQAAGKYGVDGSVNGIDHGLLF